MANIMRWVTKALRKPPFPPLIFPTGGYQTVPPSEVLEEERFEQFKQGQYYPANIGEVLTSKYQVIGKLGFGTISTVWLARDLEELMAPSSCSYKESTEYLHTPLFGGNHSCLVQIPMWESFRDLLYRNPYHRFTEDLLKSGLMQILLALDYLHTECKLVHTDIKSDNILLEIEDQFILESFTQAELKSPSPRKIVNDLPIYNSRCFDLPKVFGRAILSDFGSAVKGDEKRNHDAQPNVYRSPEVMLKTDWSYPVDIWNVGVMVCSAYHSSLSSSVLTLWDDRVFDTGALAEVMGFLGPPPLDMLQRGKRSHEFFTSDGKWKQDIEIPAGVSLELSEEFLDGKNKEMFIAFMRGMLQWRPEDRKTAKELLQDPWLND
ncbi:uncharacterized protein N7483_001217 [Penicillium malachiteum]|uniref:uncharacterized protein n=1 Tax=Penicillium malachiteum TaxID=1324776 RepID=UPI0025478407|nr:uncharacterized protein N7483_001217 [Penicillium malachiteum]KAJ5736092.1 hypothetical protein N7483_001217 [Penicillium malachiteum]